MWNVKRYPCVLYLIFLSAWTAVNGTASAETAGNEPLSVVHCPDQGVSLEARWQWALGRISAYPRAEHIWIGFSTQRLMRENSFIGRWPVSPDYPTLSELVYGVRVELRRFPYSRQKTPGMVAKEVACLLEVKGATGRIEQAHTSDVSLSVYMMRGVLFWLGEVDREQSLSLLQSLYRSAENDDWKIWLVGSIAEAQNERAIAFFEEVLQKENSERVRRETVHALGGFGNRRSLDILLRIVRQDSSDAVRREGVGAISRLELPAAEDMLMDIARSGPSPNVRREAIHGLRWRSSPAIVGCFGDIIDGKDQPRENQRAALEALGGMDSPAALDLLIRTAKSHADSRMRLDAIDRLRDRDSPAVVNSLASIVNRDKVESVQRKAMETLARMESEEAASALIQVAQTHANSRIREDAINRLRDCASPRARDCLVSIIRDRKESERIQARALETLAGIEEEGTFDVLMEIARTHARSSIRYRAMDKLRRFDEYGGSPSTVIDFLVSAINRKEEPQEIRRRALDQLAECGTKDAWSAVMQIAAGHDDLRMRESAIDKLGEIEEGEVDPSPDGAACLAAILNGRNEPERIQRKALDALVQDGDEKARAILIQTATTHPNPRLRQEAIDRLGRTEDLSDEALRETVAVLETVVDKATELETVQRKALDTLKEIEHPGILPYLKKTAQSHPNRNVRREAQEIVADQMAESWNDRK